MNRNLYLYAAACAIILMCVELAFAQSLDTPQTRMRPIGSGSAVDQYRSPTPATFPRSISDAAYRGQDSQDQPSLIRQVATGRNENSFVRQTVFLQSGIEAPNLPGNYSLPPGVAPGGSSPFAVPSIQPNLQTNPAVDVSGPNLRAVPQINPLPSNPSTFNPPSVGSSVWSPGTGTHGGSDFAPLPQPQLQNGFATIDNCNCISAPSVYSAASGIGCGVAPCGYAAPQAYAAPPAQIAPQVILPPSGIGSLAAPGTASSAPVPSLITLGQQTFPVEVGQGLWGQPVAYVPGQGIRNWVRYFFP